MLRKFLIVTVVILLFSSDTFADIGQVEGFSIGTLNLVGRRGPIGSAQGGNIVIIGHSQQIQKPYFSTTARQQEKGILIQYGTAKGDGGISGVAQGAKIKGMQSQLTKPFGQAVQGQRLNVNLGQIALKAGGVGGTKGVQGFVGGQSQTITSPSMTSSQTQFVGIGQCSAISGGIGSTGIVVNTVNVKMGQGQIVTGNPTYPHYKK
ncbi:MAG: hypothetical protein RQ760_06145 [Sedimentisphaerales bacterium]|nr:hypothetical protein [Sedimentisphaerales bacterium]